METDIRTKIRSFLEERFPNNGAADDQDIFAMGFVNSLFAMQLVLFIEETFSLEIPNEELKLDNFRTIDAMTTLVLNSAETV